VTLVEMLGSEMLVHFRTDSPPIISEEMREAIDDEDAFEDLKRQAETGGQKFVAKAEPSTPPKVGARIDLGVHTDRLHFFDIETGAALR
jgi:multiple sugar transport system ATP-binding protein